MSNIFTKIHTDGTGRSQPLISMDAKHLVNTINLALNKRIQQAKNKMRADLLGRFAPSEMDEKQRKSLGLRKVTQSDVDRAEQAMEEVEAQLLEQSLQDFMPYILVGMCRDDTRNGIVAILQAVTGINTRIELPNFVTENNQALLDSGRDDDLDFDPDDRPF